MCLTLLCRQEGVCGGGVSSYAAVFVRCQPPLPLHRGPPSRLPRPSGVSLRNHAGAGSEGAALSTAAVAVAEPVVTYATNLLCQISVILPTKCRDPLESQRGFTMFPVLMSLHFHFHKSIFSLHLPFLRDPPS